MRQYEAHVKELSASHVGVPLSQRGQMYLCDFGANLNACTADPGAEGLGRTEPQKKKNPSVSRKVA